MAGLLVLLALLIQSGAAHSELFEVVRVVDGDTIWIEREGVTEKLRLLSVDTEEKISGRLPSSSTKPETVFGEETALWARELFETLAPPGEPVRVRLVFPGGRETRDAYGRLLAHVLLPDGRDFNLLLVRLGKSPYFTKYGASLNHDAEFEEAQRRARVSGEGIWNARTNTPSTPGAPSARRPYDLLLPWWRARARAIAGFRNVSRHDPRVGSAEDPASLERIVRRGATVSTWLDGGLEARLFGQPARFFDESDGSLTVLFRSSDSSRALRVSIPASLRGGGLERWLRDTTRELVQNYVIVRGRVYREARGFRMVATSPAAWSRAGPEPTIDSQ